MMIDFVADVDAIGDGFFVAVFADDVLAEEAVGAVVGGGGEADQKGVEILDTCARGCRWSGGIRR